ncbi:DUF3800 domain-containing protein [Flagellimonas halotolerans]|uniref:DUF3800 domain-containing protein n=1 Tax=Flagellimonas halotolerans TaxID=3112164 RepID=A0ABU6ITF0_9FLAO|nr:MULTISPECIES: DUF3800 domain-containing protein [unclassified Allomuricauda]MEC3966464.1 DUF3800 domain-containing protein [Muricauda sp. SYSU M86414]MEC4266399.1 DUF3800 domain-containing protein [Muricauda sp. SYSU M84420]
MKACYLDESGHCGIKFNPNQPVQVMAGVIMDFYGLFKTQKEQNIIMDELKKIGIPLSELKSADIYRGRNAWSKVPPKTRQKILLLILEWSESRGCKFIVSPINSEEFFNKKSAGCKIANYMGSPYEISALHTILALQREHQNQKKNKGKTVVIFDEQKKHDESLLKILGDDLSFTDGFTGHTVPPRAKIKPPRLGEIIDVPFFSKSHLSPAIQLADIVAFIVNRYLLLTVFGKPESYAGELKVIEGFYELIGKQRIRNSSLYPKSKDDLTLLLKELQPTGWSYKNWKV